MKIAELTGVWLDYWVARGAGRHKENGDPKRGAVWSILGTRSDGTHIHHQSSFCPSTDWAQGGPILERERIGLVFNTHGWWTAWPTPSDPTNQLRGPTPLIAAMRAYVASKFGDTVPDEVAP